jgi:hypothetical protein
VYSWSAIVKQANNFNGVGNNLGPATSGPLVTTLACGIAFVTQPTDAIVTKFITGTAYTLPPSGPPVTVKVTDQNGNAAPNASVNVSLNQTGNTVTDPNQNAQLAGTKTQTTNSSGLASFNNLSVDTVDNHYSLHASSSNLSTNSGLFDIHQAGSPCQTNADCNTDVGNGGGMTSQAGTIDAPIDSPATINGAQQPFAILSETLDFGVWPQKAGDPGSDKVTPQQTECSGYSAAHYEYDTFAPNSEARFYTTTITTTADSTQDVAALIPRQQVCFATADKSFPVQVYANATWTTWTIQPPAAAGTPAPYTLNDGTKGWAGLLPTCDNSTDPNSTAFPTVDHTKWPCVLSRSGVVSALGGGTLTVVATSPFDGARSG